MRYSPYILFAGAILTILSGYIYSIHLNNCETITKPCCCYCCWPIELRVACSSHRKSRLHTALASLSCPYAGTICQRWAIQIVNSLMNIDFFAINTVQFDQIHHHRWITKKLWQIVSLLWNAVVVHMVHLW